MSDHKSIKREKIIGLLGGMGPEATIDIFKKIVQATPAKTDADHLRILIDNNPKMPSRQDSILNNTKSPAPAMSETAQNLERAGADCIVICANTAHHFYDAVKESVQIEVLNIINETVNKVKKLKKVGVLATTGAMKAQVFQKAFARKKMEVIGIPDKLQDQIQDAIFAYKFDGLNKQIIKSVTEVADFLINEGAEAIIMGCTEIPIILRSVKLPVTLLDPNEIIANIAVNYAKGIVEH